MSFYLALVFILFFTYFRGLGALCSIKVKKNILLGELFLFSVAMAILAFYWEPIWSMDLYRHLLLVKQYMAGMDYWVAVSENGLFLWNLFCLLSARLGNEHFLPAIMVFITYYYFYKSCQICFENFYVRNRVYLLFLGLHFTLVPPIYVFSGLRNTCAFSALAYCILHICYERNNSIKKILIPLLLAVGIHGSSWIIIGLLLLHQVKVIKKGIYTLLFVWSFGAESLGNILVRMESIGFLVWNGKKILEYFGNKVKMNIWELIAQVGIFIFLMLQLIFASRWMKNEQNIVNQKYLKFLWLLMAFSTGSFLINVVFTRMLYLLGFLLLPFLMIQQNIHDKSFGRKLWYYIFVLGDIVCITGLSWHHWIHLTSLTASRF